MDYYRVLESRLARYLHQLPHDVVKQIYIKMGRLGVFDRLKFLPDVFRLAGIEGDSRSLQALRLSVLEQDGLNYADVGLLMYGSEQQINSHVRNRITVEGGEIITALHGKPFFMACAHFTNFYTLLLSSVMPDRLSLIRRYMSPGRDRLLERVGKLSQRQFNSIALSDRTAAIKISREIRKGYPVAGMIDYFFEDTSLYLAPFMGNQAATPAGIPMLATRLHVPILFAYVLREADHFRFVIKGPLVPDTTVNADQEAFRLVCKLNSLLEEAIYDRPSQWTFWPSLPKRWSFGERASMILDSE